MKMEMSVRRILVYERSRRVYKTGTALLPINCESFDDLRLSIMIKNIKNQRYNGKTNCRPVLVQVFIPA